MSVATALAQPQPQARNVDPRGSRAALTLLRSDRPQASPRRYQAKEMIFLEGEPLNFAYQVVEGAVRLLRTTPDGRRQLVGYACPGEWIAIGSGAAYSHTAEALVDSRLRAMSRAEMDRRMRDDRAFLNEMLDVAASRLQQAEEQMILLGQRSALEKVASFLLTLGRRLKVDGEEMVLPLDRADIADYLGLTIETVSRKFTQLKTSGLIALPTPSRVRICDRCALEAVADGDVTVH